MGLVEAIPDGCRNEGAAGAEEGFPEIGRGEVVADVEIDGEGFEKFQERGVWRDLRGAGVRERFEDGVPFEGDGVLHFDPVEEIAAFVGGQLHFFRFKMEGSTRFMGFDRALNGAKGVLRGRRAMEDAGEEEKSKEEGSHRALDFGVKKFSTRL